MRRDSIFYQLFQQLPHTLFDLLGEMPPNASGYRFDAVTVKETAFQIDGLFLPPESTPAGIVYFCEVQFQKDEHFYERLFGEIFIYLNRYRSSFSDWRVVVIYPNRQTEQSEYLPYEDLLDSQRVYRVYLNELAAPEDLSLGVALISLTALNEKIAPQVARQIAARTIQEPEPTRRAIIDLLTTIMVYKFTTLSREEVKAMLGFTKTELRKTRFYQDVKEELYQDMKKEVFDEGRQQGRQEGRQEGQREGECTLILRQLHRRLGILPDRCVSQIDHLSLDQLEFLGEALLDFQDLCDLETWLGSHPNN